MLVPSQPMASEEGEEVIDHPCSVRKGEENEGTIRRKGKGDERERERERAKWPRRMGVFWRLHTPTKNLITHKNLIN